MAAPRQSSSDLSFFSKKASTSSASQTTVTTRVVTVNRTVQKTPEVNAGAAKAGAIKLTARSATPAISASGSSSQSIQNVSHKRKSPTPDVALTRSKKQRLSPPPVASTRGGSQTRATSRASSSAPSRPSGSSRQSSILPPYNLRESKSRSVSVVPAEPPAPRECWIDTDGKPGPGFLSSEAIVKDLMKTYKSYFKNPNDPLDNSFEPHPTRYPVVELEYPNTHASEQFILLVPKDKDHYNPIMCLESTLHTIIRYYLTPQQQALFGTLPSTNLAENDSPPDFQLSTHIPSQQYFLDVPSPPSSVVSSASSPASSASDLSSSSTSSVSSSTSVLTFSSSVSSLSSISELSCYASQSSSSDPPSVNYLRLLQRAINKQDGPLFLKVMAAINTLLRSLKYPSLPPDAFEPTSPNQIVSAVRSWTAIPKEVINRIIDETYQRAVGPHVSELKHYEAFSSEVYGELMPLFVSRIIEDTRLGPDSLFVDLGSGVGNVVMQASLQTGCRSFGVEIMPIPSKIACSQLEQFRMRCRMWGVTMGEVELEEGDMLKSKRVDELVAQADVVLVNNKVFLESLNEAIRPKFLDLKEGAVVVSLKPFVSSTRLTERNLDDISGIFQVSQRNYYAGSVSWGNGGGHYYLHRVDRKGYADSKRRLENSRITVSRTTRSRR